MLLIILFCLLHLSLYHVGEMKEYRWRQQQKKKKKRIPPKQKYPNHPKGPDRPLYGEV